ncbi:DUF1492 domain-containing protein [Streptococcus sp. 121]|uniref:DUF1492 domain-containing protein n=1 Tax=Streptococcus sp. 121 TaxID=2797637 RepID=UPI0018F0A390|nr:DUF1492 domain-containing protein [Streptococcus sp. 121]MBJ6745218.1 DUF1492 domain-containing protein [Streptococcus sp. 121]
MTDIKRQLDSLKHTDEKVESIMEEIQSKRSSILKSQQYTDEPKGSIIGNQSEELYIRITDETSELYNKIQKLLDERKELTQAIESLDDPIQNLVLRLLYINGYSWKEVQKRTRMSSSSIQRARDKAFSNLSQKFGNNGSKWES